MKTVCIVIPAHNEAGRIGRTLAAYCAYFDALKQHNEVTVELLVVLNGCTDTTRDIVQEAMKSSSAISFLDFADSGKGFAIKAGFQEALTRNNDYIGFVDADMATEPRYFNDLIKFLMTHSCDGVIASRYMPGAVVTPPRPFIKSWGRKIFYHSLVRLLFGLWYKDLQCGAKLFRREVVAAVTPSLTVRQWAFDVELLYLCKKKRFVIKEIPTVWHDQADSKLRVMRSGMRMLGSLFQIRYHHLFQ